MSILAAPLYISEPRWTSQDIADHIGVSQSAIARAWRKSFAPPEMLSAFPRSFSINTVIYAHGHGYLIAETHNKETLSKIVEATQLMRSPRRIPLQTALAGICVDTTNFTYDIPEITSNSLLITTDKEAADSNSDLAIFVSRDDWQSILLILIQTAFSTSAGNLRQLHQQIVTWARKPAAAFTWSSHPDLDKRASVASTQRSSPRTIQQVISDQCFEWIVDRVWSGDLTAGDRITETALARALHTTRNQTRDALRSLASAGLLDHHPTRGVLVPAPTKADIADLYAARRSLGNVILARTISNPQMDLAPVKVALDQLIELAHTGNSYETGNADMRFQDAIAEASGMRNIPQMFATLAKQVRIYIAVMGLAYIYSIDDMVKDDTTLFRYIASRETDKALDAWNKKIDDVIEYMSSKVIKSR